MLSQPLQTPLSACRKASDGPEVEPPEINLRGDLACGELKIVICGHEIDDEIILELSRLEIVDKCRR